MQTRVDLVNYVLYQAGWLALVLLAAAHRPLMATVVGLGLVAVHLALVVDRRVELADVEAELERVRRNHRGEPAVRQLRLDLAPPLRQVACAVRGDLVLQAVAQPLTASLQYELRDRAHQHEADRPHCNAGSRALLRIIVCERSDRGSGAILRPCRTSSASTHAASE